MSRDEVIRKINGLFLEITSIDRKIRDKYNEFKGVVNTTNPIDGFTFGDVLFALDEVCELRRIRKDLIKKQMKYFDELEEVEK